MQLQCPEDGDISVMESQEKVDFQIFLRLYEYYHTFPQPAARLVGWKLKNQSKQDVNQVRPTRRR